MGARQGHRPCGLVFDVEVMSVPTVSSCVFTRVLNETIACTIASEDARRTLPDIIYLQSPSGA